MRSKTRHLAWILSAAIAVAALAAGAMAAEGKVNINEASVEQLALLPRVGPAVAQRIVDFREENGGFKAVEDLMLVRGIGEKTFEKMAPYVAISGKTTLSEKVPSGGGSTEGNDQG